MIFTEEKCGLDLVTFIIIKYPEVCGFGIQKKWGRPPPQSATKVAAELLTVQPEGKLLHHPAVQHYV